MYKTITAGYLDLLEYYTTLFVYEGEMIPTMGRHDQAKCSYEFNQLARVSLYCLDVSTPFKSTFTPNYLFFVDLFTNLYQVGKVR